MKNQTYVTNDTYADVADAVPTVSYGQLMPAVRRDTSTRALKALEAEHNFNLAVERSRAELAFNAMNLTAQLASVEQALSENCPSAEPCLKALVKAFAYAQATKIISY